MAAEMEERIEELKKDVPTEVTGKEVMEDLENRFTYHKHREGQPEIYSALRDLAKIYAKAIVAYTPKSREQSLALTKLEESVFWANASIARSK